MKVSRKRFVIYFIEFIFNSTEFKLNRFQYSINGTFLGGCLDARDVPECDVDECAFWENSELDEGKTLIISLLIITQERYFSGIKIEL